VKQPSLQQSVQQAVEKQQRLAVAPSPLNGVKLELGFILLAGIVLWLAADSITANVATQLLLLSSFGLSAAGWLVWRTRRVVRRLAEHKEPAMPKENDCQDHEAQ
jgi:hypothetical protein